MLVVPYVITIQRLSFLQRFLGLFSHLKNTVVCAQLGETRNLALRAKVGDGELGLGVYEGLLVSLGLSPWLSSHLALLAINHLRNRSRLASSGFKGPGFDIVCG